MTPNLGFIIWFTGLPASGKTTLARLLQTKLAQRGIHTVLLDSDELRHVLTPNPVYTAAERDWFYGVIAHQAWWLAQNQINVLIAATANKRAYRAAVRAQHGRFVEVFVQCDIAVCQQRDPKGLYANAAAQDNNTVPGRGTTYEPPENPELIVDTVQQSPQAAVQQILHYLQTQQFIPQNKRNPQAI